MKKPQREQFAQQLAFPRNRTCEYIRSTSATYPKINAQFRYFPEKFKGRRFRSDRFSASWLTYVDTTIQFENSARSFSSLLREHVSLRCILTTPDSNKASVAMEESMVM